MSADYSPGLAPRHSSGLTLDVVLPTFNRAPLLARTLASLARARLPRDLRVRVIVVDNASTDGTRELVASQTATFPLALEYAFVATPGKPHALNTGVALSDADLIGLIDDDEEVDEAWFECIRDAFRDPNLDFAGGRCLPRWESQAPAWLGQGYRGVIGWVDPGPESRPMDASYPGILMGGNAVIRRALLARAGRYSTALNRTGTRLLGCEDEDMYHRLLALRARGRYIPALIIYHFVPSERLTKRYFRRWCFWRGVSLGVIDRDRPAPVAYLAGVPRYQLGRAARGFLHVLRLRSQPSDVSNRFESELACWDVAGFAWGKHVHGKRALARPVQGSSKARTAIDRETAA